MPTLIQEISAERQAWPYPSLIPHSIKAYPIVQIASDTRTDRAGPATFEMRRELAAWRDNTPSPPDGANLIYVHVPFCPFLCHFCPLYKSELTGRRADDAKRSFVAWLIEEIQRYARFSPASRVKYSAVYFGGGTPTELLPEELGRILQVLRDSFDIAPDAEITLEGVARHFLATDYLDSCLSHGFSRISWGIQSLDPQVRRAMGRGDAIEDYARLVQHARAEGRRVSLNTDLMAGLPGQSLDSLLSDVRNLITWGIESIDVYYYVMMPGTKLHRLVTLGSRSSPQYGEGLVRMREGVNALFKGSGYEQLTGEVFAGSDRDLFTRLSFGAGGNRLNSILALGPSAFGFLNGTLYHNVPDLRLYGDMVGRGLLPFRSVTRLSRRQAERRAILLGLLSLSISRAVIPAWLNRFVERWLQLGLVEENDSELRLTPDGAVWYNMMQHELLTPLDLLYSLQMLGSLDEQRRMQSSSDQVPGHYRELRAVLFGRGRLSRARQLLYEGYLFATRWLPIDDRAIGFTSQRFE